MSLSSGGRDCRVLSCCARFGLVKWSVRSVCIAQVQCRARGGGGSIISC